MDLAGDASAADKGSELGAVFTLLRAFSNLIVKLDYDEMTSVVRRFGLE
jgi:hypothetical protein